MKHLLFLVLSLALLAPLSSAAQSAKSAKPRLLVSFQFKKGGIASSQFAIWIQNSQGEIVRTLAATSFTVRKGYAKRPDALPVWVSKSKPGEMTASEVDAVTTATPRSGLVSYAWDGLDDHGLPLPEGDYTVCVEGTLYWESRVIYSGSFHLGGTRKGGIPLEMRQFGSVSKNSDMITEVVAKWE